MSMPSKAIVAAMLLFVSLPAEAQFLGPGMKSNIELTKNDLAIMRGIVDAKIHGRSVGATASWSNPEFGQLRNHNPGQKIQRQRPTLRIDRLYLGDAEDAGRSGALQAEQLPATRRAMADLMSAARGAPLKPWSSE